jgi:hypothetical protein
MTAIHHLSSGSGQRASASLFRPALPLLLPLLMLWAGLSGCGLKLPPSPPNQSPPPAVTDLSYGFDGDGIFLVWTYPKPTAKEQATVVGFKVFRARIPAAEADCKTCQPRFVQIGEMLAFRRTPGSRVRFPDALEPGTKTLYKVVTYSSEGVNAKDSNRVEVTP